MRLIPLAVVLLAASTSFAAKPQTGKIVIAVMDIENGPAALSAALSEALDKLGAFKAITRKDMENMVNIEQTKQLVGCQNSSSCIAELGNAMGTAFVLTGSVSTIDKTRVLQLQLVQSKTASVVARVSQDLTGDMLEPARKAAVLLVRDILKANSGRLQLELTEEGATVRVDHAIVGTTPLREALSLAAGPHELVVEKEGFVRQARDIQIPRNNTLIVSITLLPSEETRQAKQKQATLMRGLAWGGLALGVAAGAAAVATGVVGAGKAGELKTQIAAYQMAPSTDAYNTIRGNDRALAGLEVTCIVMSVLAVAGLATGATLFAVGDSPSKYSVHVGPTSATLVLP